jgi:YHS domain-containing protein
MAQALDLVCGMTVDTDTAEHTSEYEGATYYFCAAGCKRAFDKNPTEFVGAAQATGGDHAGHEDHEGHGSHQGHNH